MSVTASASPVGAALIHVRAPASTANVGAGFDCVGVALDLCNELIVETGGARATVEIEGQGVDELPRDLTHLAIRAFGLFASTAGCRFRFRNRIPLERGLGSSASAIALGLLAGDAAAGAELSDEQLLAAGAPLEGHTDNLAAALLGGVCVSWSRDGAVGAKRLARDLPLAPVLVVPPERTSTRGSRAALPFLVKHDDAAASAGAAALLGAAIASGDAELFRVSIDDRLHEPYRSSSAPLLAELRERLPRDAAGVTLSGSGPSVVVWAYPDAVAGVVAQLEHDLPRETTVLPLRVAQTGASVV